MAPPLFVIEVEQVGLQHSHVTHVGATSNRVVADVERLVALMLEVEREITQIASAGQALMADASLEHRDAVVGGPAVEDQPADP